MHCTSIMLFPLVALAAACAAEPPAEPNSQSAAMPSAPGSVPSNRGDIVAAPIDLGTLRNEDIAAADLEGELGCAFLPALGGDELWIGQGDVPPGAGAQGLIRIGGESVKLTMTGRGGYDAMADGAQFTGGGVAVSFARTGSQPMVEEPGIEMESPAFTARMIVARGSRKLAIDGVLECGP